MTEEDIIRALLNTMREGLLAIGYHEDLLQENYSFTDMFVQDQAFRSVEIGVLAPIPNFTKSQMRLIVSLVREYISVRSQWDRQPDNAQALERSARGIMGQIDAELLRAYNLPAELERELVNYFAGYQRPGPMALTHIKPSPEKRLFTSIIRIEDVRNEGDNTIVDAVVINWNPHQIIHLPLSLVPQNLRDKLAPDVRLLARVNIGAQAAEDLFFEAIELVPESEINDRFA